MSEVRSEENMSKNYVYSNLCSCDKEYNEKRRHYLKTRVMSNIERLGRNTGISI